MNPSDIMNRLASCLSRLPGVGRRSAERMALALAGRPDGLVDELIAALKETRGQLGRCSRCGNLTSADQDPCRFCSDPGRDGKLLCVVEDPGDILPIERSGGFHGRYHALMGKLSPMKGEGPASLRIGQLVRRVAEEGVEEVILALNTDVEGDATASYLTQALRDVKVKVSRLASGLPAGSGVMYADPLTLSRAFRGRQGV